MDKLAKSYLEAHFSNRPKHLLYQHKNSIERFYLWLNETSYSLRTINQEQLNEYYQNLEQQLKGRQNRACKRRQLQNYFLWLYKKGVVEKPPQELFPRYCIKNKLDIQLPPRAEEFLSYIDAHKKKSTVKSYKGALKYFYDFLTRNQISFKRLSRTHIEKYMMDLKSKGYKESTRATRLIAPRIYLRWLFERGYIQWDPDQLIRDDDFPKVPRPLPRYLPQEVDEEVQKRLFHSKDIVHQALLLMRKTGIRVGELRELRLNCVWENSDGHSFLKVELGKLDTERLVPLSKESLELAYKIQEFSKKQCSIRNKEQSHLIHKENGKRPLMGDFHEALEEITRDINTDKPIVSHQFRHSYATQLLNSGLNMSVLKELLGHKCVKMTLRYAKLTLETVFKEFEEASMKAQQQSMPFG